MNPLKALSGIGQSPWLDFMRRNLIGPDLDKLIADDGLGGMTSNPAIFEKAIGHSDDYDEQFGEIMAAGDQRASDLYEAVAIRDIQMSADHLRPVYERTKFHDGFVSLEVSPYLALDTGGTIAEARRLWKTVDRPNLMVKVPGTSAGIPAIETLIGEGININVTLLFSEDVYVAVAEAYIRGLEKLASTGADISRVASVASFFVSRIDSLVDSTIGKRLQAAPSGAEHDLLQSVKGKVAIANAKLAYQQYKRLFSSPQWQALDAKNAQTQRLLWASTGTKNPAFPDTLYVDTLIGRDTVNTMPPATMDAFRDHGTAKVTIEDDLDGARKTMADLGAAGISMKAITDQLVDEGVQLFADAFDKLLEAVEGKRVKYLGARLGAMTLALPDGLSAAVTKELDGWRAGGKIRRLFARDASLWTGHDEAKWLGWLDIVPRIHEQLPLLQALAADAARYRHVLIIGMGGSSLGPEVLAETFGRIPGHPQLHVIDSTDPDQIRAFEGKIDLASTLFVVSSKSGSTLEPNILKDYFFHRVVETIGAEQAGSRFVAVTDPGSQMQKVAEQDHFSRIFFGDPAIGGRYSVLSAFGMVPAAAAGIDLTRFLESTSEMLRSCGPEVPPAINPGVILGTAFGVANRAGRDKVTILAGPGVQDFGAWAEQLLAESTGKQGHGIVPVDAEPVGKPGVYGNDRLFVHLTLSGQHDPAADAVQALQAAGQPVIHITLDGPYQLGQEFVRWEIATAVAGSIIGINAFDQPDVEASKIVTRKLTSAVEESGSLPAEAPFFEEGGIKLYADPRNVAALKGSGSTLGEVIAAHFARVKPGDYAAFLGYMPRNETTIAALQHLRLIVRDGLKIATCVGFGPRFLHSTGQAYKGGPNSGVFLQFTCDHAEDLPVPGHRYGFAIVEAAQARGDFAVLAERERRVLRIHLPVDIEAALDRITSLVQRALGGH